MAAAANILLGVTFCGHYKALGYQKMQVLFISFSPPIPRHGRSGAGDHPEMLAVISRNRPLAPGTDPPIVKVPGIPSIIYFVTISDTRREGHAGSGKNTAP